MSYGWKRTIEHKLDLIIEQEKKMSQQMDDLTAEVKAAEDTEAKAVALLTSITAQLQAAIAAGADPAALQALHDELKASTDALAAEVAKDTPPAPPTPAP